MSKLGVNVSIDVKSIDKARLVAHQNGKTYLNMTVFIDPDNPDNYGQHGMITQDVTKPEKDQGVKGPILGNVKVFWKEAGSPAPQQQRQQAPQQAQQQPDKYDDDHESQIPF